LSIKFIGCEQVSDVIAPIPRRHVSRLFETNGRSTHLATLYFLPVARRDKKRSEREEWECGSSVQSTRSSYFPPPIFHSLPGYSYLIFSILTSSAARRS